MYFPLQENMQYDHCVLQTEWVSRLALAGSRSVIVGPKLMINIISDVGSGQKMAFQFQFKYGPLAEMLYIVDLHM